MGKRGGYTINPLLQHKEVGSILDVFKQVYYHSQSYPIVKSHNICVSWAKIKIGETYYKFYNEVIYVYLDSSMLFFV